MSYFVKEGMFTFTHRRALALIVFFYHQGVEHCAHMEKTDYSVINLLPPRDHILWDIAMEVKKSYFHNMRAGPHITVLDPFILPRHYPEAAAVLRKVTTGRCEPWVLLAL